MITGLMITGCGVDAQRRELSAGALLPVNVVANSARLRFEAAAVARSIYCTRASGPSAADLERQLNTVGDHGGAALHTIGSREFSCRLLVHRPHLVE
jgi:hypothetical protein